jgi:hypothetical protein
MPTTVLWRPLAILLTVCALIAGSAGSATAAPTKKPKPITDLVLTATVPSGIADTTTLVSGDVTRRQTITFTFTSAVPHHRFTCVLDGDRVPNCTSPRTYSGLAEGQHVFRVIEAARGYRTTSETFTWTIDITPPDAVVFDPYTSPAQTSPAITFDGGDASSFTCAIDGGDPVACTPGDTGTADVTGNGGHILTVVPRDEAGNVGPAASATWIVDTVGPTALIQDPPPDPNNLDSVTIHFSASGADAATHAVQCKLDDNTGPAETFADCSSPFVTDTLTDGTTYTFTVRATDAVGLTGSDSATWTFDSTALDVPVLDGPPSPTNDTTPTFTWALIPGATFQCSLDGGTYTDCTSGLEVAHPTVTDEGEHTFQVRASTNPTVPASWVWELDTTDPELSLVGVPTGFVAGNDFVPAITTSDAHPGAITCSLTGPTPLSTCGPWTDLADGAYTLTVSTTDQAGNGPVTEVVHFTVDTAGPTATVRVPRTLTSPAVVTYSEPVRGLAGGTFGLVRTSDRTLVPSRVTCRNLAGATVACSGFHRSLVIKPRRALVPGEHYRAGVLAGSARDAAGNLAAAAVKAFRAQRDLQESTPAAKYKWAVVSAAGAYGGKYSTEHLRGARSSWSFRGGSLTWWTRKAPNQGKAVVLVDGNVVRRVDNYAASAHNKVARTFTGLGGGRHTVTIVVTGKKRAAAKGAWISIDAFTGKGSRVNNPVLTSMWGKLPGAVRADKKSAAASLRFRGTGITWVTRTGRDQGIAKVFIDGKRVAVVDNYAAATHTGVKRVVSGLADRVHTLRIVVTGRHRAAATASRVTIDRYLVA